MPRQPKPGISRTRRISDEGLARLEKQLQGSSPISDTVLTQWIRRYGDAARELVRAANRYHEELEPWAITEGDNDMTDFDKVAGHYTQGSLLQRILRGVELLGKTPQTVTVDDLAPADEFHIGGRTASEDFTVQLGLGPQHHVLDIGCGIGGTSRFIADRYGCQVSGVDITPEFIQTGQSLCDWTGLGERVHLQQGNALDMPYADACFDAAVMLHVGMNIADKAGLFAEVFRVLRPGTVFGVYDVMLAAEEPLVYPVPWSSVAETSALASPEQYIDALEAAGFSIHAQRDRRDFAAEFFAETRRRMEATGGTPALGVHIAMGDSAPVKIGNMIDNIAAGRVAPVEIIARKN